MYNSSLKRKVGLKTHTRLKSNKGLERQKRLNPKSKKRQEEDKVYYPLIEKLRRLCKNKSELSGKAPNHESDFIVDPHHIDGRIGYRYIDPFNLILLTRPEHNKEEGKIRGEKPTDPEILKAIVYKIRVKQGFKPEEV